jgi:hypothetical protein
MARKRYILRIDEFKSNGFVPMGELPFAGDKGDDFYFNRIFDWINKQGVRYIPGGNADVNIAETIAYSIARIQKAGFDVNDTTIRISSEIAKKVGKLHDQCASYVSEPPETRGLYINNESDAWKDSAKDLEKAQRVAYDAGDLSHWHPSHNVVHEFGHMLHHKALGNKYHEYRDGINGEHPFYRKDKLTGKVSKYAMSNALEFVAEVFSGIVLGKKYDADVMEAYADWGGPMNDTLKKFVNR